MKRQITIIRLIRESFRFAFEAIRTNRLRTVLSLLGITVGIFAIISVYSVTDSMERTIRGSIQTLGENTLYVMKWPWEFGSEYPWWKYLRRPLPSIGEYEELRRKAKNAEAVAFVYGTQKPVEAGARKVDNANLTAVSDGYEAILGTGIRAGRYFSSLEVHSGASVAVIGPDVAERLFRDADPLGQALRVMGRKIRIIGIFERQGEGSFGNSTDNQVMIPLAFAMTFLDTRFEGHQPSIVLKAAQGVSNEQLRDEVTGLMRSARRLNPRTEDNFAINETSLLTNAFEDLFRILRLAGWFIGGFSILVGGFGIANIMFVSVRERTPIIGIQKSLGAKRYFILLQFLFEAMLLSLIGGVFGLLLVFAGTAFVTYSFDMDILLSADRIMYGIIVSAVIGLISGILPAWQASRKDPVEAIRSSL